MADVQRRRDVTATDGDGCTEGSARCHPAKLPLGYQQTPCYRQMRP